MPTYTEHTPGSLAPFFLTLAFFTLVLKGGMQKIPASVSACRSRCARAFTHTASVLSTAALRSKLLASSTSAAQAPWARSPAAVVAAAAAAADGAGWGAEASQWHPERRDAAAATPTRAGRAPRRARELHGKAARPGPGRPAGRDAAGPSPRHVQEAEAEDQRGAAAAAAGAGPCPGFLQLFNTNKD